MPSAIQMEALKKLRLVQLISRGKVGIFGVVFFFFLVSRCLHILMFACFRVCYFRVRVFSCSPVFIFACFHV